MIWADIKGYEGLYRISSTGKVYSVLKSKVLKPRHNLGYPRAALYKEGRCDEFLVHRLVAETFIPNPLNLDVINHKDEDRSNNDYTNLEWCTKAYNTSYSCSVGVLQMTKDGEVLNSYVSAAEGARSVGKPFGASSITLCCRGKRKTAYGYKWRYSTNRGVELYENKNC